MMAYYPPGTRVKTTARAPASSEDEYFPESASPLSKNQNRRVVNQNFLFFCQIALLVVPITILYAGLYFMNASSNVIVGVCGLIILCLLVIVVFARPFSPNNAPTDDSVPLKSRLKADQRSPKDDGIANKRAKDDYDCPSTLINQEYATSISRTDSSETLLSSSSGDSEATVSLTRGSFENSHPTAPSNRICRCSKDHQIDGNDASRSEANFSRSLSSRPSDKYAYQHGRLSPRSPKSPPSLRSKCSHLNHGGLVLEPSSPRSHGLRAAMKGEEGIEQPIPQEYSGHGQYGEHGLNESRVVGQSSVRVSLNDAVTMTERPNSPSPKDKKSSKLGKLEREDKECLSCLDKSANKDFPSKPPKEPFYGKRGYFASGGDFIQPPTEPPSDKNGVLHGSAKDCLPCGSRRPHDLSKPKRGFLDPGDFLLTEDEHPASQRYNEGAKMKQVHPEVQGEDKKCRAVQSSSTDPHEGALENKRVTFSIPFCKNKPATGKPIFIKLIPTSSKEGLFELDHDPYGASDRYVYTMESINQTALSGNTSQTTAPQSAELEVTYLDGSAEIPLGNTTKNTKCMSLTNAMFVVDETQKPQNTIQEAAKGVVEQRVDLDEHNNYAPSTPNISVKLDEKTSPVSDGSILDFVLRGPFSHGVEPQHPNYAYSAARGMPSSVCENSTGKMSVNLLAYDERRLELDKSAVKSKKKSRVIIANSTQAVEVTPEARNKPFYQPQRVGLLVTESSREEVRPLDVSNKVKKKLTFWTQGETQCGIAGGVGRLVEFEGKQQSKIKGESILRTTKEEKTDFKFMRKSRDEKSGSLGGQRGSFQSGKYGNFPLFPPINPEFSLSQNRNDSPTMKNQSEGVTLTKYPEDERRKRRCLDKDQDPLLGDYPRAGKSKVRGKSRRLSHRVESTLLKKSSSSYDNVIIERIIRQQGRTLDKFK